MNSKTEKIILQGGVGSVEALLDRPDAAVFAKPLGLAVVAHPHPLFGGAMDNKVVQTVARAFVQCGWTALRFNFRGVGASAGVYDEGRGEADDLIAVAQQQCAAGTPLCVAGFSFGAFVATHTLAALAQRNTLQKIVLVGTATSRFDVLPVPTDLHERTLVLHCEADDTVPLASVMDWARPQQLPVTVVPAGGHFFHGQLPLLKSLVQRHVAAPVFSS